MQQRAPSMRADFPVVDMSAEPDPEAAAMAWMHERILRRLDLEHDALWIGALLKLGPQRFMWFQCCHHVALDGITAGMIAARLAALYTAFVERRASEPHAGQEDFVIGMPMTGRGGRMAHFARTR